MRSIARCIANLVIPVFLIGTSTFAATYQASVAGSIHFAAKDTIAIGNSGTLIYDFFDPGEHTGNAGSHPFAGVTSFDSEDQLLSISLEGPSGFANPTGRSEAAGSISSMPVFLRNLSSDELPLSFRVEYSYSLSATAGEKETASSSIALELLGRESGSPTLESLFRTTRAFSQNGSTTVNSFFDVFVTLAPEADLELVFTADTAGEAVSAVPEPGTFLAAGAVLGLFMARARRSLRSKAC